MQPGNKPIRYVAEVAPVREVTLHGVADLAFWQEKLRSDNLQPVANEGQAQVFLSATEARFLGIRFRECIIGIHVEPRNEQPAMYLIHAWNSLQAFAWIERNMFGTAYYAGEIALESEFPANFMLAARQQPLVLATLGQEPREPQAIADEHWQGTVFLPRKNGGPQKLFVAKLAGRTEQYAFVPSADLLTLGRSAACPPIGWLIDSGFTPQTWAVRQAAAHAKSKTYRADQFFAQY